MSHLTRILLLLLGCFLTHPSFAQLLPVNVRGHDISQSIFSLFARPGEVLNLGVPSAVEGEVRVQLDGVSLGQEAGRNLEVTAPVQSGLYQLHLEQPATGARTRLNLFVGSYLRGTDEFLEGYRIGAPPFGHSRHPDLYRQPRLYFRVTDDMLDIPLSEHFTLGQFLCKQESEFPKYVIIRESLLVLLEGLIDAVQAAGYPVETFGIISAYRTPDYNRNIGNVSGSRHVYGDAMDFFIDVDEDGVMDDLNGDGVNDHNDVDLLHGIVEIFKQQPESEILAGGVGRYFKTSNHGGFVHVDARGYRARW